MIGAEGREEVPIRARLLYGGMAPETSPVRTLERPLGGRTVGSTPPARGGERVVLAFLQGRGRARC